jgi:starch-binding outer membrane protein, SusD/RagB family
MRKIIILLPLLFCLSILYAQNIGIGTNSPNSNAVLDIKSDTKGILVPRMDSAQRKNIANTKGLLVYDSTFSSFWYNTGSEWLQVIAGKSNTVAAPKGKIVGDMLYWNGTAWTLVPVGLPGQALVLSASGVPTWGAPKTDTSASGNAYFFPTSNNSAYKNFLGLLYARLAVSDPNNGGGPFLNNERLDIDFVRSTWILQEVPTDEAILAWQELGIPQLNQSSFSPENAIVLLAYLRIRDIINNANSFLAATTDERLQPLNLSLVEKNDIKVYRAEARYLRAFAYYHAIDLFGNFEFSTETSVANGETASYGTRANLFNYVESELLAIENDLLPTKTNEYGRADKSCAWMLLAKLYLNAQVYTGSSKYTQCLTYINKIIGTTLYSLTNNYNYLFLADNNLNGAQNEIIFPIVADGQRLTTFGNTTFLTHASVGGSMLPANFGILGGWAGLRCRREFVNIVEQTGVADTRNMLYKPGQSLFIQNPSNFVEGYGVNKYKNKNVNGTNGVSTSFVGTDFPVYRLADVWLMYTECVLRGGQGGTINMATTFMNFIRGRSGALGVSSSDITLNFVLDERARELYWEGHRRSDLIRFNKFTGLDYLWQFKGGIINGTSTYPFVNLYPIPTSILTGNGNMVQNLGY